MHAKALRQTFVLIVYLCFFTPFVNAKTEVSRLLCEYHNNPAGIDVVQPRLSWQLFSDEQDITQTAYEIRVASTIKGLSSKSKQLWNSGKISSSQSVNVVYEGPELASKQRVYWQVRVWDNKDKPSAWSEPAYWETGLLNKTDWQAKWITLEEEIKAKQSTPAHYYRKTFKTSKKIKTARACVSALGLYELYLNGQKVGNQLFTPGWTSYKNRVQYQVYDVSELVENENALGAIVGDGWYRGFIAWSGNRNHYGENIALLVQLNIEYTDGSKETIVSDESWKASHGPIRESDIYNGELYDANYEVSGWSKSDFDDAAWKAAKLIDNPEIDLVASMGEPVMAINELKPIEQLTTPKGEMVYDMGQNMVGWVRLKMTGNKGDTVQLKFAEVLDKDGNFYTDNLRAAKCTDTYVFAKSGELVFEPKFTFHGFRYLQLIGLKEAPANKNITGVVIHSNMKPTGTFSCSNDLINQLQHNIQWGQKGNFLDVPTDCPQRDERLGWTGDAQAFAPTAAFNFNVAAFYTKWMKDVALDQLENGSVPHVIPDVLNGQGAATGWADAVAIIPWTVYKIYNDERILEESYPAIKKWVAYMSERAGDDFLWIGDQHFGDWLAFATTRSDYPGATTEKDLIATAYFYYTTRLTAKIARIIGENNDAAHFLKQAENIKQAFINEFVTPNGRLVSHTQTAYVLALTFDLIPDDLKAKAAAYLSGDVEKFKHLTTGFLGTPLLCLTLSEIGRDDLAFMLLNRTQYPSWLYPVTQGATTIWERWDGQKTDGTFQSVGMNSFNHYAYGAIGEWLYGYVAGIKVDEKHPGYKKFTLAPHPGGGLTFANAEFDSMYGTIKSDWKISDGQMTYQVEIPANTSAEVVLPKAKVSEISMNEDLKSGAKQAGTDVTVSVGSGTYTFTYPMGE